jgi:hypothetical protein
MDVAFKVMAWLKAGPQLFRQHDHHVGLAIQPERQAQGRSPEQKTGLSGAHVAWGVWRAIGLSRTGRFTSAANTPSAMAKYQTMS